MIPHFNKKGNLPPGQYLATWAQIEKRYGHNEHRLRLLQGLKSALENLRDAGCRRAYLDGSFISTKEHPADFDLCWEPAGVDVSLLDPLFAEIRYVFPPRREQKAKYFGEVMITIPCHTMFDQLNYFQQDDRTGDIKGIIAINLDTLP